MNSDSEFWIDHLAEKHECFGYSSRIETIEFAGKTFQLHVPQWAVEFELVEAVEHHDRLFLILRDLQTSGWEDNLGIVAIATKQADNRYAVVLWHSTYPYLWKHLS